MRYRGILPCLVLLAAASALSAQAIEGFDRFRGRDRGIGGPHVALADDLSVIMANPAGLAAAPRKISFSELGLLATGPLPDIADVMLGSGTDLAAAAAELLKNNNYKLYASLAVDGPVSFGFVGGGLGFGLFNKTKLVVNAASASSVKLTAREDLVLVGGYAFRIGLAPGHVLDIGVSAKGFVRGEVAPTFGAIELVQILTDPMAILKKDFVLTTGIGADIGLRWSWEGRVAVGLVCRDAYSPAVLTNYKSLDEFVKDPAAAKISSSYGELPRTLDFGAMWAPRLGGLETIMDSAVLLLDYGDILDLFNPIPRNPILNVRIGAEARILEIITFRVGIKDALLNAGIGMDLGAFQLSLAAFGKELGLDPGSRPVYNLLLSLDFTY